MLNVQSGDGGMSVGIAQGESLVRDIALADAKLTSMMAQRRAIIERIADPTRIPISLLIQLNPVLKALNERRSALVQQRLLDGNAPDDPLIVQIDREIEQIDAKVKTLATDINQGMLELMMQQFRLQDEMALFQLELEIRVQEILVAELTRKLNEQQIKSVERSESVLDVMFEQAQLERTNRTLSQIEERILAITTEQRAPAQITPLTRAVVTEVPR